MAPIIALAMASFALHCQTTASRWELQADASSDASSTASSTSSGGGSSGGGDAATSSSGSGAGASSSSGSSGSTSGSSGGSSGDGGSGDAGPAGETDAGGVPDDGIYLGVTCGWQYSAQLTGPVTYPNQRNISLYNPDPNDAQATWDSWVEQLAQAGVDYVCPNLTGSHGIPGNPPSAIAPILTSLERQGLADRIKIGLFDDNAASWCAQWNAANGRGFGYAQPFDLSDPANWVYIYDYNYKIFYQTIPDRNLFKIQGRPVIIIWTSNPPFVTNAQGNLSKAMLWVRQQIKTDFGYDPYIVGPADFLSNDTTCADPGVLDGVHHWFYPPDHPYTLQDFNGTNVGVAVAQFQHSGQGGFLDPNHGKLFDDGLSATVGAGARLTLCEGFTDYEEDAAMFRVRNLASDGTPLTYDQTNYDYPNQRLNILRKHSRNPIPATMKFEAEACDTFGGANGGNGQVNYYRNGNIAIEATTDTGGGHDVGWMQPGEWFEWQEVPLNGTPAIQVRVATADASRAVHVVLDGTSLPPVMLPNTGGLQSWATVDLGSSGSFAASYHTVRIVFDSGGASFNWWQTAGGTSVVRKPPPP
jgi:hypothetical protein